MARLTPEQMAEIAARDALWSCDDCAFDWSLTDRRALLAHVKALEGELADVRAALNSSREQIEAITQDRRAIINSMDAMSSDLAACRRDAERYRWLRLAFFQRAPAITIGEASVYMEVYGACPDITDVDAAIDAALSAQAGKGE